MIWILFDAGGDVVNCALALTGRRAHTLGQLFRKAGFRTNASRANVLFSIGIGNPDSYVIPNSKGWQAPGSPVHGQDATVPLQGSDRFPAELATYHL